MRDDNLRFTWEEDDEEGPGMYRVMDHAGHYDDVLGLSEAQARLVAFAFNASSYGYSLEALERYANHEIGEPAGRYHVYDGPAIS